jgi:hypothetical protein
MARQHLLDQCRARARHAENEDRRRRRVAEPLLLAHQFRREHLAHPLETTERLGFVIGNAPLHQRVAGEDVLEGLRMSADIPQYLAEREMQVDLLLQA